MASIPASAFRSLSSYGLPYQREWQKAAGNEPLPATGAVRLVDVALDMPRTGRVSLRTDAPGAGEWEVSEGSEYAQVVRRVTPDPSGQDFIEVAGKGIRVSWVTTGTPAAGDRAQASYGVRS